MRNSAYTQKRIVYASIKTLQIELLPSSARYVARGISSIAPLGSEVSTAIKCSVSLPDD